MFLDTLDVWTWVQVLANFVAVNTILFAILAIGKLLPRVSVRVYARRRHVARMRQARARRKSAVADLP